MAVKKFEHEADTGAGHAILATWRGLGRGDVGAPYRTPTTNRTVQVLGRFGVGGAVRLEGSLLPEPTDDDWCVLNDPQGNPLTFTSGRVEQVQETTPMIRPRVTAGDEYTALTVVVRGEL